MDGIVKLVSCLLLVAALLASSCAQEDPSPDNGNLGVVQRFDVPIVDEMVYAEVQATKVLPPIAEGGKRRVRCEVRLKRADGGKAGTPIDDRGADVWIAEIGVGETVEKFFGDIVVEEGATPPLNSAKVVLTPVLDGPNRVSFTFRSEAWCIR